MMAAADPEKSRSDRAPHGDAAALVERVRRVIDRAQAVPVVASEELEGEDLKSLRDEVFATIDEATSILSIVLAQYDRPTPDVDDDWDIGEMCGEVDRRMDDDGGVTRITGVAFVAQLGLRGRKQMLASVGFNRKWDLIAACSSAVREVLKSASAVELAIGEHEDLPATSRYYVSELERALAIRRAYVRFRQDVINAGQAAGAKKLRLAASAIAKLVGRPAYASARVHDRCQIRQFHARIREQLLEYARTEDPGELSVIEVASSRLYQDLVNLAELMMQINLRAELREHDAVLLANVFQELRGDVDLAGVLQRLGPLLGRDPELDQFLTNREASRPELREVIARCLDGLSRMPERDASESKPSSQRRKTDAPDRRSS